MMATTKGFCSKKMHCSKSRRGESSIRSFYIPLKCQMIKPLSFISITLLLVLWASVSVMTNVYLASWLPGYTSPKWIDQQRSSTMFPESIYMRNQTIENPEGEGQGILHIVTTRFMQNQAQFIALGNARLRLFETFCLPSMKQQLASDFLWFIMTDPNLDSTLMNRLVDLLAPHSNFFLILHNDQTMSPQNITDAVDENRILSGDTKLLLSTIYDKNRQLLLETRLDSDDALDKRSLYLIQDAALDLSNDREGWQVICNGLHYEWRNPEILAFNQSVQSPGRLRVVQESICVTPGFTLVKHRSPYSLDIPAPPRVQHHVVTRQWPRCGDTKTNSTTNCWVKMKKFPSALRCRTVTSAGMSRIETNPSESSIYDNQTDIFWQFVAEDYGILPEASLETSLYLQDNLHYIVHDNLLGQCTSGHSCKKSSRDKLGALFNESLKFQGRN